MSKRVIKLRGTQDFRRIERRAPRPKQPSYTWNGKAWVLSQPSQKMTVDAGNGVIWTSCAAGNGGNGGGGIGQGTKMQTAWDSDYRLLVFLPAVGVMFNLAAGSIKNVTFSRPCIDPTLAEGLKVGFEEPDFNTFQQQYAAYLAGRNNDQQNVNPMEMQ